MTRLEQISIETLKLVTELNKHLENGTYKNDVDLIEDSIRHLGKASAILKMASLKN
jgi:hypothetical protein